jgi:cytochrome c biogenesis protein
MSATDTQKPELDATKLSTQPAPVEPTTGRTSLVRRLIRGWRVLTSMRTALLLLFLLALAAIPGSLLPQRGLNPVRVTGFFVHHPSLAPKLDKLYLFDVFASPWFAAIYVLLFVSLVGCVLPRLRVHWRSLRTPPPKVPRNLSRLAFSTTWTTPLSSQQSYDVLRAALRRRRWKTILREDGLAAESGRQRETGNLLFHAALVLLLLGIALGSVYGYQGTVLVSEGHTFTNTVTAYDQFKPGRLTNVAKLSPFSFTLDKFDAQYQDSGEPKTFSAHLSYQNSLNGPTKTYDLRVNHPLRFGSSTLYLLGHGYSLHVSVRDASKQLVYDDVINCLPQDSVFTSICTIKVPDTGAGKPQLGFLGFLFPTAAATGDLKTVVSTFPAAQRPYLSLQSFSGNLGLGNGVPQSVYSLNTSGLKLGPSALLDLRNTKTSTLSGLGGGASISIDGISQWATFQVKRDPFKKLTLVAAIMMVLGLIGSLFIKRRRLWVRTVEGDGRTLIEVGALSRTDADGFEQSFQELVLYLQQSAPPTEQEVRDRPHD